MVANQADYGKHDVGYKGALRGDDYDVVIIGAGPAGLTAGIYAGRRNLRTLILAELLGGQMNWALHVENYAGFSEVAGPELIKKMVEQAKKFGCEVKSGVVVSMQLKGAKKTVKTRDREYSARSVIIATGGGHKKLNIPGEDKFVGRGVSYCATCDAPLFGGKRVAVMGGSDAAVTNALYVAEFASETYLVHRRDELRAEAANQARIMKSKVKILWSSTITEIKGAKMVEGITVEDMKTHEKKEMPVEGVFIYCGVTPATEIAKAAGIGLDDAGFVKTDRDQKTNIDGVYAAGDVTGGVLQIAKAVGEGAVAATNSYHYLQEK